MALLVVLPEGGTPMKKDPSRFGYGQFNDKVSYDGRTCTLMVGLSEYGGAKSAASFDVVGVDERA
jgi:hypothetical protein